MLQRPAQFVENPVDFVLHVALLWPFAPIILTIVVAKNNCKPRDCYDLKCYQVSNANDGPHFIYPESANLNRLEVSCDQTSRGGGWILLQRRVSGYLNFNRTWAQYRNGFGYPGRNFTEQWLGNENVHEVILSYNDTPCELRIEGYGYDGGSCYLEASHFRLDSETNYYTLRFDSVTSAVNASNIDLLYHQDQPFKTYDANRGDSYCTNEHKGGWWFNRCANIYLNGPYKQPESIFIKSFEYKNALRSCQMLFRPSGKRGCRNPCENGGTCLYLSATDSRRCVCPSTHCGTTCEKDNPCENGGICEYIATTNATLCECAPGFNGSTCRGILSPLNGLAHTSKTPNKAQHPKTFALSAAVFLLLIIVSLAATAFLIEEHKRREEQRVDKTAQAAERHPLLAG